VDYPPLLSPVRPLAIKSGETRRLRCIPQPASPPSVEEVPLKGGGRGMGRGRQESGVVAGLSEFPTAKNQALLFLTF
jgi:hypothetical protein